MIATAPQAVSRWYLRMMKAIEKLNFMPMRFSIARESKALKREICERYFGKRRGAYRILFAIDGQQVNVLHVRRASRQAVTDNDLFL